MNYQQLIETILQAEPEDWLRDDERSTRTFKPDLDIRLREKARPEHGDRQRFEEEWATKFPDSNAYVTEYELWYAASFVKTYPFVDVDGYRASLPFPKSRTEMVITREQLAIANAVNGIDSYYKSYIGRFEIAD